jgi:P27 family predicted phage terminase small subunit
MNEISDEYRELSGGSERKSRAKASEIAAGKPLPPTWMSKPARKEFKRVAAFLADRGTVSPADGATLTLYACSYSRFITAQQDLDTRGQWITVKVLDSHGAAVEVDRENPSLKLAQTEAKTILAFLRQLGMTPATREKVKPTKPKDENADGVTGSDVDELIRRAGAAYGKS